MNHFRHQHLKRPHGVLIHLDNIYITDTAQHTIFQFNLSDLTLKKRVGKKGSGNEGFDSPRQLAISPNQHLYVADSDNNRLQIMSENLAFQGSLRHQTMYLPVDVKFSNNEMFVLSWRENACIHVFNLSGKKSHSISTSGELGLQVDRALSFCLDGHNNIVISDCLAHNIKVFSPEGELLHTIGQHGFGAGMFIYPTGITIYKNKLISLSYNPSFGLQLF